MRIPVVSLAAPALIVSALIVLHGAAAGAAAQQRPGGPRQLGKFDDWTAATYEESGAKICYAFTRPVASVPSVPGRDKDQIVLSATERPSGRDAVAMTAGFAYAPGADVSVQVDQSGLDFYTAQRSAFARDGAAAVVAFQRGRQAVVRSPGPRGTQVVDTFSLKGFTQAYAAVQKACPAR